MNTACWCATWSTASSRLMQRHSLSLLPYARSPAASSPANTSAASRCRRTRGSPTAAVTPASHQRPQLGAGREAACRSPRNRAMRCWKLAFGWLLGKPMVASVIAGATKPEQIEQNVAAERARPLAGDTRGTRPHRHHDKARAHHRRIGRRPVRRQPAARRRLGRDGVRAQPGRARRPRRRHRHAPAASRRDAAAQHPVRQFDGHQRRQGRFHRPRRQGLRRARHRARHELVGTHLPLAARPGAIGELSPRHDADARRAGCRAASPRSSPTARASAATC